MLLIKVVNAILRVLYCQLFSGCGKGVKFFPTNSFFTFKTIKIGNNVYIGPNAHFSAVKGIYIGNKVLFGPGVTIIGGDHRFDVVGEYMIDVHEKLEENDLPVFIKDDVWIGANVTILKGVTVGRGSIIGAGSVVTSNVPDYSVYAGVPAKFIKNRFSDSDIKKHESLLQDKTRS